MRCLCCKWSRPDFIFHSAESQKPRDRKDCKGTIEYISICKNNIVFVCGLSI